MENPIVLKKVSLSYDQHNFVIQDFSLSINLGEFFCLIGPSGCGKSTVLKLMSGIEKPSSGQIVRPDQVGMVFQTGALLPWLTVEQNVAFAAKMKGFSSNKVAALTDKYLAMVGLEFFRNKYPRELSGGQRQRIGIARALSVESQVLLLDEPFSALDPLTTEELHKDLLEIWQKTKKTIVMVSHSIEEAVTLANRIGIMRDGKMVSIIEIKKDFYAEVDKIKKILHNERNGK